MASFRLQRINNLIARIISQLISGQKIKDPRVSSLLSISEVEVSKDLSHAKVGVSGLLPLEELETGVLALNHAAGFIQSQLGAVMQTRVTPKLRFYASRRIEQAFELTKKLEDLVRESNTDGTNPSS